MPEKVSMNPDSENSELDTSIKCANFFYVIVFIITGIFCFILYSTGYKWLGKIISTKAVGANSNGVECVCRTTAPLAIWFAVHSLIMIGNPNLSTSIQTFIHKKFLYIHIVLFVGIWVAFWFVGDGFTKFYLNFSIYVSALFIIIQIFFLLEFFQEINAKFVQDDNLLIPSIITIVFSLLTLTAYGVSFYIFCPKSCNLNLAILIINLILSVIIFILAAFIEHASILTASFVCAYCAYLVIAGCMCQTSCNRISTNNQGIGFSITASIITLIWCGYSAFSSTISFDACDCGEVCGNEEGVYSKCCPDECCGEERKKETFSLSFFHFLFALASVYLTMIVTHWGKTNEASSWTTNRGQYARWANYISSWVVILIYFWTLIAPKIFPDRDFS